MDALVERARDEWLERSLADRTSDRPAITTALGRLYEGAGLARPTAVWTATSVEGARESQRLADATRDDPLAQRVVGPSVLVQVLGDVQARLRGQLVRQVEAASVSALDEHVGQWLAARLALLRSHVTMATLSELGSGPRRRPSLRGSWRSTPRRGTSRHCAATATSTRRGWR